MFELVGAPYSATAQDAGTALPRLIASHLSRTAVCALCLRIAKLRSSHILPKFVSRRYKKHRLVSKRMWSDGEPVQDALHVDLLCDTCEQLFSKFEHAFSADVMDPIRESGSTKRLTAESLLFQDSICWRTIQLQYLRASAGITPPLKPAYLRALASINRALRASLQCVIPSTILRHYIFPRLRLPSFDANAESFFSMGHGLDCVGLGENIYFIAWLGGGLTIVSVFQLIGTTLAAWQHIPMLQIGREIQSQAVEVRDLVLAAYMNVVAVKSGDRGIPRRTLDRAVSELTEADMRRMITSEHFGSMLRDLIQSNPRLARTLIKLRGEIDIFKAVHDSG